MCWGGGGRDLAATFFESPAGPGEEPPRSASRFQRQDFEPPSGKLAEEINGTWGSLDNFISKFNAAATGVQVGLGV